MKTSETKSLNSPSQGINTSNRSPAATLQSIRNHLGLPLKKLCVLLLPIIPSLMRFEFISGSGIYYTTCLNLAPLIALAWFSI